MKDFQQVSVSEISKSGTNPRPVSDYAGEQFKELVASIKESGLAQPILVRPEGRLFVLVSGERRWRAAQAAGLKVIPAYVRDLDDQVAASLQQIENLQRVDLPALAEAKGYKLMIDKLKISTQEAAVRVGKQAGHVVRRLRLLDLHPKLQAKIEEGDLEVGIAEELTRISSQDDQVTAFNDLRWNGTLKDARHLVESRFLLELGKARFDVKDAQLVPAAGACGPCAKHTGAQVQLFGGTGEKDLCLDSKCWAGKLKAHSEKLVQKMEGQGKKVLQGNEAAAAIRGGELVHLDDHSHELKGKTTFRQVIKGKDVEVVHALDSKGIVHEMVDKAQAFRKGDQAKVQRYDHQAGRVKETPAQKKAKQQARQASKLAFERAAEKALAKLVGKGAAGLKDLAQVMIKNNFDYKALRGFADRRQKDGRGDGEQMALAALKGEKALAILWDLALGQGLETFDVTRLTGSGAAVLKAGGVDFKAEVGKALAELKKKEPHP